MEADAKVAPSRAMNGLEEVDVTTSGKLTTVTSTTEQVEVATGAALFDMSSYTGGAPLIPMESNGAGNVGSGDPSGANEMFDHEMESTQHLVDKSLDGDEKKMGRPSHPAWQYFVRGEKRNRFHHNAYCRLCSENGADPVTVRGVSGNMIRHLQKCIYCPTEVVTQLKLLCAQRDAANFNKRHQSHNRSVNMLVQEASSTPKKTRRSEDQGNNAIAPLQSAALRGTEAVKVSSAQDTTGIEGFMPLKLPLLSSKMNAGLSTKSSPKSLDFEQNISMSKKSAVTDKAETQDSAKRHDQPRLAHTHKPIQLRMTRPESQIISSDALSKLVMSSTLSTNLPWDWTWTEQAALLFGDMHSEIELPSAELLRSMGTAPNEQQILKMKDEQVGVTMAVNWWMAKYPRSSFVLISIVNAIGEATTWELYDMGIEDSVPEALAEKITHSLTEMRKRHINVINIVADTTLAYTASRLAVNSCEWTSSSITVLPCFSHLLQVLLGIVMTESARSTGTVGDVIELIQVFSNHRVLKVLQRECGDPDAMLHAPTQHSWYSFIEAIDSVRQYEDMIKIISSKVVQASSDLKNMAGRLSSQSISANPRKDSAGNTVDELMECGLSSHVIRTIQDPGFWENVVALSEIMSPLKETYKLMNTASTSSFSLSDIFYQFGRMHQQYRDILSDWEGTAAASGGRSVEQVRLLLQKVNDMWKLYDQPLMMLGYTFNYNLARYQPSLQWLSIGRYAKHFFRCWFCDASSARDRSRLPPSSDEAVTHFMEDILAFKERKYPFDPESTCDFDNPRFFYMLISDSHPLMHMFGSRLFSFMTSTPPLSDVIPGKSFIPSAPSTKSPQETLLPLLRVKLFARTTMRPSKDFLGSVQRKKPKSYVANMAISDDVPESMSETDETTLPFIPSFSPDGQAKRVDADETFDRIWCKKQWTAMSIDWKAHWEKETDTSHLFRIPKMFTATTSDLALDEIFKDKLPSRLPHDREDAVVDV